MFNFSPDPLFYTVGFEPRVLKATEKQINKLYQAGYLGLKTDEAIATYSNMRVDEYRLLRESDQLAARAVEQGRVDSEARTSMKLIQLVEAGEIKAIQFKLTHRHDWMPAKPEGGDDKTVTIRVVNAEIADDEA